MHVTRAVIRNYRTIRDATVDFRPGVTVIVGDNETGKSTLLEAIHAAISGQVDGRSTRNQIHPFWFNRAASHEFLAAFREGRSIAPPEILVEVYFSDDDALTRLKGSNNTRREDAPGISLRIRLIDEYAADFAAYMTASKTNNATLLPVEFYDVEWMSFAYEPLSTRRIPFKSILIDPTGGDSGRRTGRYLSAVVGEHLTDAERRDLSLAYRSLKLTFQELPAVKKLNNVLLSKKGQVSDRTLSIAMDMTGGNDWDHGIAPLLDEIPFDLVGKGEQSAARIWLAVDAAAHGADLVMLEEPENHLSYGRLNILLERMCGQVAKRQMIVSTHSSFVLNKLGLDDILLFGSQGSLRLTELDQETTDYFKKLPGHDTLRMVLAKRVKIVEGASDELVVQRAYRDRYSRRPIEDGVDVLSVRSLSFKRYLSIAKLLKNAVIVITDNDANPDDLHSRYKEYDNIDHIRICFSSDAEARTLELQIAKVNTLETLNLVLQMKFLDAPAAAKWMLDNKTEAALRIHDSETKITYPEYILRAIS